MLGMWGAQETLLAYSSLTVLGREGHTTGRAAGIPCHLRELLRCVLAAPAVRMSDRLDTAFRTWCLPSTVCSGPL